MNKKGLRALVITLSLTMFLFVLGATTFNHEDPPLKGENINTQYHIC